MDHYLHVKKNRRAAVEIQSTFTFKSLGKVIVASTSDIFPPFPVGSRLPFCAVLSKSAFIATSVVMELFGRDSENLSHRQPVPGRAVRLEGTSARHPTRPQR